MSYLLDTNVLSETRKRRRDPGVVEWLSTVSPDHIHISVLTIGEIEHGIAQLLGRGDQRQATLIETWLNDILDGHAGRIVPVSVQIARYWGSSGGADPLPVIDALIAATAIVRGWTLVTRNTKDVQRLGVPLLNPFAT